MSRHVNVVVALVGVVLACGCTKTPSTPVSTGERTPIVYVVNYPLRYLTERIGGSAIDVRFPAPEDGDPAFWRPDPDVITAYQGADLILLNGATYARWSSLASLPASKMVDTSLSFTEPFIEVADEITHSHGPSAAHAHGGTAFTTWLDFEQAIAQAHAVRDALVKLRPASVDVFDTNLVTLTEDLRRLDEQMMSIARQFGDEPLVASHPVYQYWARRYDLDVRSVLWEPDVVPDDRSLAELRALLAEHPAAVMIWEGDADPRSVKKLEALGVRSVVFDPCGNVPDDGDFVSVMDGNIAALRALVADDAPASTQTFEITPDEWTAGFADLPVDHDPAAYELESGVRPLPSGLDGTGHFLQGHNRSDDLFMFLKTRIDGLRSEAAYRLTFTIDLATSVPPGMVGIGGSPGESVYVKAGATGVEPARGEDDAGYWRMNIDKGNQARDGVAMINLGNVAHPDLAGVADGSYRIKRLESGRGEFTATSDGDGGLWVIVGTDSGFEGLTRVYVHAVLLEVEEVGDG